MRLQSRTLINFRILLNYGKCTSRMPLLSVNVSRCRAHDNRLNDAAVQVALGNYYSSWSAQTNLTPVYPLDGKHRSSLHRMKHQLQLSHSRPFTESLQQSTAVEYAEAILQSVHAYTGLPWWLSIILTTCTLRTLLTFPVSCYSTYNLARFEALQPEIKEMAERLRLEVRHAAGRYKWTEEYSRDKYETTMKKLISGLYERDNCHPFKSSVVILIQLPLWFTFSLALRNLSGAAYVQTADPSPVCESLKNEGVLWFTDLTLVDPTLALPIAFVVINLLNIQLNAVTRKNVGKHARRISNLMRAFVIIMFPVASAMPSCMSLYWSVSSLCGLVQNVVMLSPPFRRMLGIPQVPSENATPFTDIYKSLRRLFPK